MTGLLPSVMARPAVGGGVAGSTTTESDSASVWASDCVTVKITV